MRSLFLKTCGILLRVAGVGILILLLASRQSRFFYTGIALFAVAGLVYAAVRRRRARGRP